MKTIISNSYNTTSTHLGNCKNTRTLFTNWYNKTQRGNMPLAAFLNLDFIYQLGIFQLFLQKHNIGLSINIGTFDLFIISPELLPIRDDMHFYWLDDNVPYIHTRHETKDILTSLEDVWEVALIKAFNFLNEYKMADVPF